MPSTELHDQVYYKARSSLEHEPAKGPCGKGSQLHPVMHQGKHCQQVEEGDPPLSTRETSGVLGPAVGSPQETWTDWSESSQQPQKRLNALSICHTRRGRELGLLSLEKSRFKKNLNNVYKHLIGGSKEDGARLFSEIEPDSSQ